MVTISIQHLQDVFTPLGLELQDNNNDRRISSPSTTPTNQNEVKADSITFNVQTAPNQWGIDEYNLTENDLSSFEKFTAVVQKLSGNKEIFILGNEAGSQKIEATGAYAVLKRSAGVYNKKYIERDFVDYVNLETGSSLVDAIDLVGTYAYRSIRYIGHIPRLSLFDDVPALSYQVDVLKYIKQDADTICSDQTSRKFEAKCREDVSLLTQDLESSLPIFVSAYLELEQQYSNFEARFERGALQFSDVVALESAFAKFEPINEAYKTELKMTIPVIRDKKQEAEEFRRQLRK